MSFEVERHFKSLSGLRLASFIKELAQVMLFLSFQELKSTLVLDISHGISNQWLPIPDQSLSLEPPFWLCHDVHVNPLCLMGSLFLAASQKPKCSLNLNKRENQIKLRMSLQETNSVDFAEWIAGEAWRIVQLWCVREVWSVFLHVMVLNKNSIFLIFPKKQAQFHKTRRKLLLGHRRIGHRAIHASLVVLCQSSH